ncbi:MAG: acetyl-CoA carboxylase biotin carboxyl carrier protein [Proteobacteria bacterium]|nr:acetyl-CoA carboxylase biotin carboxyl carrier protein [Pseudomonadota bacterium]
MPTKKKPAAPASPELNLINSLAEILNATGLSEIELEQKGVRVKVSKALTAAVHAAPVAIAAPAAAPVAVAAAPAPAAAAPKPGDHPGAVKSPMVGTAYLSPSPGSPAFVAVGSNVKEGQTVLIIEAMKTMNQITAPRSGKVVSVLVENGQPVEFGEALLVIE